MRLKPWTWTSATPSNIKQHAVAHSSCGAIGHHAQNVVEDREGAQDKCKSGGELWRKGLKPLPRGRASRQRGALLNGNMSQNSNRGASGRLWFERKTMSNLTNVGNKSWWFEIPICVLAKMINAARMLIKDGRPSRATVISSPDSVLPFQKFLVKCNGTAYNGRHGIEELELSRNPKARIRRFYRNI
jgi:hypothetical protein